MVERKEGRQTFQVSIRELAEVNPQTAIYNSVSYHDMETSFAPELYDPIQLARVQIGEGADSKVVWQIVDGHTKTKFAIDHGEEFGITHIEAYDSTQALLANPRIAPDRIEGQSVLTMPQYLRAVVEPTRVHQEIAPRRIAAHLINGWESIVGQDLASRFSATAAMNLLSDIPTRDSDWLLEVSLKKISKLLADETEQERLRLESGILQMNTIFKESKIRPSAIHKEAFSLIASHDPIIGGERQAMVEVYGLINLPAVSKKITSETGELVTQKMIHEQLGKVALAAMSHLKATKTESDLSVVSDVLLDSDLTLKETLAILGSESLPDSYGELKTRKRQEMILTIVSELSEDGDVTEFESELIVRFSEINLRREDLPNVTNIIHKAGTSVYYANELIRSFSGDAETLTTMGVRKTTIERSLEDLTKGIENLSQSQSHHQLKLREKELSNKMQEIAERILQDKLTQTAHNIIDKEFLPILTNSFKDGVVPLGVRNTATSYLLEQHRNELTLPESRNALARRLKYLDSDLMMKVFDNRITLVFALQLQEGRGEDIPKSVFAEPTKKIPQEVIDFQNKELHVHLKDWIEILRLSQLELETMTEENRELAWGVVKQLVKILSGHPDAQRVIEDYPNLLRKLTKLQERSTLD